jgi:S-adenosylmethionine-diacylgycerolhomoserine-N-methlytransferase
MAAFMSMRAAPLADVAHCGLMDKVYRRQRYIYDFTRKYYLFGRDALIRNLDLKPGQRLVEIGCGTARNLIAIARRYPQAKLYGLDASAQMLETARLRLAKAGLGGRVRLVHGLAENLSPAAFGEESFDHALFSYSLSMIPGWRQALAAAGPALSSQGLVHIVDFGDFHTLAGRKILLAWLGLFHVSPRVELLAELLAGLEAEFGEKALVLLPGRYAFLLSLSKGKLGTFACGSTVTARN